MEPGAAERKPFRCGQSVQPPRGAVLVSRGNAAALRPSVRPSPVGVGSAFCRPTPRPAGSLCGLGVQRVFGGEQEGEGELGSRRRFGMPGRWQGVRRGGSPRPGRPPGCQAQRCHAAVRAGEASSWEPSGLEEMW